MYEYDEDFYRYISEGAADSARELIPALLAVLPDPVQSVLDVGCGAGAWLAVWKSHGARVTGLDGDYVSRDRLLIDTGEFVAADLAQGFDLGSRYDLVQSLEVAEHLPASAAEGFVASLCRHADRVLFSAAPPGQGGENHVNEQPYQYWRDHFRRQGFAMYDPVRGALAEKSAVKPWYRYNTFLFVREDCEPRVHQALAPFLVADGAPVPDVSPVLYQWRKRLIRLLPVGVGTWLAILKKNLFGLSLRLKRSTG